MAEFAQSKLKEQNRPFADDHVSLNRPVSQIQSMGTGDSQSGHWRLTSNPNQQIHNILLAYETNRAEAIQFTKVIAAMITFLSLSSGLMRFNQLSVSA